MSSVSDSVVVKTILVLGPAAQAFIEQQSAAIGVDFASMTVDQVPKIADAVAQAASAIVGPEKAEQLAANIRTVTG